MSREGATSRDCTPRRVLAAATNPEPRPKVGICVHCERPIWTGQPYRGRIPFIGSWGGLVHQVCPPKLVRS